MGIEIEMEKKKLTDEEIVNALEDMASECETNFSASVVELIHRQKAEIERLTEKCKGNSEQYELGFKCAEEMFNSRIDYCIHIESQNRELQKQVDELNKKLIARESVFNNLVIVEKDKSVKATAKEIFILAEDYNCGYETDMDNFMKELKERYGVEVE